MLDELYLQYRPLLFSLAYQMLGTASEAEDIVQETFISYIQVDPEQIHSPKAYLCKIATNLCLDTLKSARNKRETYVGPWLPEPILMERADTDPAQQVVDQDLLSIAYLTLMETLTPTERAVYLLREAFGFPYQEIANIVDKKDSTCRKLFERAKKKMATKVDGSQFSYEQNKELILSFVQALQTGNMQLLLSLISEDVVLYSDGGGVVKAALNPIVSRDHVLSFLSFVIKRLPEEAETSIRNVNGQPGILSVVDETPFSVVSFLIQHGQIKEIYLIRNPHKLENINFIQERIDQ